MTAHVRVPVVLPLVEIAIDSYGAAAVTVDREPYGASEPIDRGAVEALLLDIAGALGPVRVQVTEADGTTFTDIVIPPGADGPSDAEQLARPPDPVGLGGNGFAPGEDVDIAVIVTRRSAAPDGRADLRLPPALLRATSGTLVLLGRTSGRYAVCELA
ncbi:cell wall protein [Nocardioides sp. YIM 152588]|uniref:cell wall protein n=1 Tax=Nocardioides sp. YIM 152588 TaxID=3158259 RepID=UPI0032E42095